MITFKNSKLHILIISIVEILMGVYIATIRINYTEAVSFFNIFTEIKEGLGIDITSNMLDINIIVSILNIIISVPLISTLFNKKYLTKCFYIALRQKSYLKFYCREMLNLFIVCTLSGALYNLGILAVTFSKYNSIFDTSDINLFLTAVINSVIITFTITLISAIISTILNEKISIIIVSVFTAILALIIFFIPDEWKPLDIISWYYVSEFINNKILFPYPLPIYYLAIAIIDTLILFIGGIILKRKDVL